MPTPALLLLILALPAAAAESRPTLDAVPLDELARRYYADARRIEVYYPKQFERLEMDWHATARDYLRRYDEAASLDGKLDVLARLYNSWNNGHHSPLGVKGLIREEPAVSLYLPFRVLGTGIKLSRGRLFVTEVMGAPENLKVGDEIVRYDGLAIKDYIEQTRDEISSESPEAHIAHSARYLTLQNDCRWGKRRCWREGQAVELTVADAETGTLKEARFAWTAARFDPAPAPDRPAFPPEHPGWTFRLLDGPYAPDRRSMPEGRHAFLGRLEKDGKKWLIIKMFLFRGIDPVQAAIKEARKPGYEGVILDFSQNGGGDDSAMTFLGGILGTSFHLELSAIRLAEEFNDLGVLQEATFGPTKAAHLFPYVKPGNLNKMSPFTPFGCLDKTCPMKTEYSFYVDRYKRPAVVSAEPVKKIALITGIGTASKTDSVAALFRATKIGPIVGTPAVATSGTYYFRKDYAVPLKGKEIVVSATFTPDFSLGADCQEVQANPPQPDAPVERTFANRAHYDALTWIAAAEALRDWNRAPRLDASCSLEQAKAKLAEFGLQAVDARP